MQGMRRPLINLALLLAVSFSFGGLGQLLHERYADAGHAAHHDHESCPSAEPSPPRVSSTAWRDDLRRGG